MILELLSPRAWTPPHFRLFSWKSCRRNFFDCFSNLCMFLVYLTALWKMLKSPWTENKKMSHVPFTLVFVVAVRTAAQREVGFTFDHIALKRRLSLSASLGCCLTACFDCRLVRFCSALSVTSINWHLRVCWGQGYLTITLQYLQGLVVKWQDSNASRGA